LIFTLAIGFLIAPTATSAKFIQAKPIKRAPPFYPRKELIQANDGLVEIIFMVDYNGEIFEPVVINSTSRFLEKPALAAVRKYKYQPTSFNDKPVSSQQSILIRFEIANRPDAVSPLFGKAYKAAVKELGKANPNLKKNRTNE